MKLYNRPFHWWGDCWTKPSSRTLNDLVQQDVMTVEQEQWLVGHVLSGGSIIVAAEASRSGKSTLANALLESIPKEKERIYVRGTYEPFDWVESSDPGSVAILVNEFSPHLPVYTWGKSARRVLELANKRYQVVGSMHGERPQQIVAQLMAEPIGASVDEVVALDTIVFRNSDLALGNRFNSVSSIWRLNHSEEPGVIVYERVDV